MLFSLFGVVLVGCAGYIAWGIKQAPSTVDMGSLEESYPKVIVLETNESWLAEMDKRDVTWLRTSTNAVKEYEELLSQNELLRQKVAQERLDAQQQFFDEQLRIAREEQALLDKRDAQAREAIASEGGIDIITDRVVSISPETAAALKRRILGDSEGLQYTLGTLEGNETPNDVEGIAEVSTEQDTELNVDSGVKADGEYYGQFTCKFLCSCASCFDSSLWKNVGIGENVVLSDGSILPTAINVKIDGVSGARESVYSVCDGYGLSDVNGRNVVAFTGNHSFEINGATLYPKVTRVG